MVGSSPEDLPASASTSAYPGLASTAGAHENLHSCTGGRGSWHRGTRRGGPWNLAPRMLAATAVRDGYCTTGRRQVASCIGPTSTRRRQLRATWRAEALLPGRRCATAGCLGAVGCGQGVEPGSDPAAELLKLHGPARKLGPELVKLSAWLVVAPSLALALGPPPEAAGLFVHLRLLVRLLPWARLLAQGPEEVGGAVHGATRARRLAAERHGRVAVADQGLEVQSQLPVLFLCPSALRPQVLSLLQQHIDLREERLAFAKVDLVVQQGHAAHVLLVRWGLGLRAAHCSGPPRPGRTPRRCLLSLHTHGPGVEGAGPGLRAALLGGWARRAHCLATKVGALWWPRLHSYLCGTGGMLLLCLRPGIGYRPPGPPRGQGGLELGAAAPPRLATHTICAFLDNAVVQTQAGGDHMEARPEVAGVSTTVLLCLRGPRLGP